VRQLIDLWFERDRQRRPVRYYARTRDQWRLAMYRYPPRRGSHRTPVLLCHGMASNRWNMDGPGRISLARYLVGHGYDVWLVELRGAGRSTTPTWWNGKSYSWTFEDYVHHDAPAALRLVLRETGARQVHWVGHSMGGMIAYALLMGPVHGKIASAVTLGSPTMSKVGHPLLDFGVPYRSLLRYLPARVPIGTLARLGAPFARLLAIALDDTVSELGWCEGNADLPLLRSLMLTAVDDLPASLLREFARWYDTKAMSDRYGMFDFTDNLERVTAPILVIAGSKDRLTPPRDLEAVYRAIGSREKAFRVIGKAQGFAHDYSHADLILGLHAPDDVYPVVLQWLEQHRARRSRWREAAESRPRPNRRGRGATVRAITSAPGI
jgi:pimeloyl-ACP methyl ester carboxylesterase